MANKAIALVSGGMDTLAAIHLCSHNMTIIKGLFFNYGQNALEKEREYANKIAEKYGFPLKEIFIPFWNEASAITGKGEIPETDIFTEKSAQKVWVPARNLVFLAMATSFAEMEDADSIIVGFNATESKTFPDNGKPFLDVFNVLLKYAALKKIEVVAPLIEKEKDIIATIVENSKNIDDFWSCYRNGDKMCGKCESCMNTKKAFIKIGKYDLIQTRFKE